MGFQRGFITPENLLMEVLSWPAKEASTVAVALGVSEAEPLLRKTAIEIFKQHPGMASLEASAHTRIAGRIGTWYLRYADRLDRLLANWPPKE